MIDRAVELTQSHHLRGYDAIQLATALVIGETLYTENLPLPVFVASDGDLLIAARAKSLHAENPLEVS